MNRLSRAKRILIDISSSCIAVCASAPGVANPVGAETLPDAPGKETVLKMCSPCHEGSRLGTRHQGPAEWRGEIRKMISLGAKGTNAEFATLLNYVVAHFPPSAFLVNVN